ncbi:hypothetical protein M758_2G224900 [Ceratodon purpureus]|nr:hypothetical protein M758_2G224900 [Ceratodon purpureus]
MAQKVFGSLSMVQLSMRLRRVTKTKQWELFQRVMLVIVLIIWFTTVMTSVFFRLTSDSEMGATFTEESATTVPFLPHARKLAWTLR